MCLEGLGEALWTKGVEPKPQKISEVGFQIRTMREKALEVGCMRAGRTGSCLASSSSNVQSGFGPCELVPSVSLASSLGRRFFPGTPRPSCILPGTLWNSQQCRAQLGVPWNTTFDIGIDIPLLHCGWDSLTLNKDPHWRSCLPF